MAKREILEKFIDKDGKMISYPSKKYRTIRPYIYEELAVHFDANKEYTEIEINEEIKSIILFDDYCIVRREMIEQGLLARTRDCTKYFVNKEYKSNLEPLE